MSELMLTPAFPPNEQRVIRRAMRLLEKYQRHPGEQFLATTFTKVWLQLNLYSRSEKLLRCFISITRITCWNMKRLRLALLITLKFIPAKS